jgi:hypothetical protein
MARYFFRGVKWGEIFSAERNQIDFIPGRRQFDVVLDQKNYQVTYHLPDGSS